MQPSTRQTTRQPQTNAPSRSPRTEPRSTAYTHLPPDLQGLQNQPQWTPQQWQEYGRIDKVRQRRDKLWSLYYGGRLAANEQARQQELRATIDNYNAQVKSLEGLYDWRASAFSKDTYGSDMRRQMREGMERARAAALNRVNQKYDGYDAAIRGEYEADMANRGLTY